MAKAGELQIGDAVRYHSCTWGWRFGVVRGLFVDGATGLAYATVQFHERREWQPEMVDLPLLRLERAQAETPPLPQQGMGGAAATFLRQIPG